MALSTEAAKQLGLMVQIMRLKQPHESPELAAREMQSNAFRRGRYANRAEYPVGNSSIDQVLAGLLLSHSRSEPK